MEKWGEAMEGHLWKGKQTDLNIQVNSVCSQTNANVGSNELPPSAF